MGAEGRSAGIGDLLFSCKIPDPERSASGFWLPREYGVWDFGGEISSLSPELGTDVCSHLWRGRGPWWMPSQQAQTGCLERPLAAHPEKFSASTLALGI